MQIQKKKKMWQLCQGNCVKQIGVDVQGKESRKRYTVLIRGSNNDN